MKNKTLKNLIALGTFAIFAFGFSYAYAYVDYYSPSYVNVVPNSVQYNYAQQQYSYPQQNVQQQYYYTQQPYTYVQPQVKYVSQPTTTQIQYVPQQQSVQYVQQQPAVQYVQQQPAVQYVQQQQPVQYVNTTTNTGNTLGATVVRSNTVATVNRNTNTGITSNTGQFVNYDANNQNMMLASAYGAYNNQPQQVAYDTNGVTALSVNGSGGFMPSSIFQWLLFILLILGIIIIARMVSKTFNKDSHTTTVVH